MHPNAMKLLAIILSLAAIVTCIQPAWAADAATSCSAQDEVFKQQDYVLGHWDIFNAGRKSAEAQVVKDLSGCAIRVTWTPTADSGARGLGIFAYSRVLRRWTYFWVTDRGQTSYSVGEFRHVGDMQYLVHGQVPAAVERISTWSLTLHPDGTIQELSARSDKGGVRVQFDLLWRKHQG